MLRERNKLHSISLVGALNPLIFAMLRSSSYPFLAHVQAHV